MAILATDLDGTLIPLTRSVDHIKSLKKLAAFFKPDNPEGHKIIYVSGRSLELVLQAITQEELPIPNGILADVGSTLYLPDYHPQKNPVQTQGTLLNPEEWKEASFYRQKLKEKTKPGDLELIKEVLSPLKNLELQDQECQKEFKSSWFVTPGTLKTTVNQVMQALEKNGINREIIASEVSPREKGLIDILPKGVNKAFGIMELCSYWGINPENCVFSGDSGNDLAVFLSPLNSILVGNTPPEICSQVKDWETRQRSNGKNPWVCYSLKDSTRGVLDGWNQFLNS